MIPIQPTGIRHYLTGSKTKIPKDIGHHFYLSWEDALWDVLKYHPVSRGSIIMVPEFFCSDVVINMETHGLKAVWYPVDQNFQTDPHVFKQWLEKYRPSVVVILHAVGITNQLFDNAKVWTSSIPKETLLIEDSVHRLVEADKIKLVSPYHIVIDSLRKVTPIQGSNLYFDKKSFSFTPTPLWMTIPYQLQVLTWWVIYQICLMLVGIMPIIKWKAQANRLAEYAMLKGYDIIGDSVIGASGLSIVKMVAERINFKKIQRVKTMQVERYHNEFASFWKKGSTFEIKFPKTDYGLLRGFPIGLDINNAKKILEHIRTKSLIVRFELDDSPWSQRQKVIYLPLGPHLRSGDIDKIAAVIKNAVIEYK